MFRALPCFIQLWKSNIEERCAWHSLITMHYFTHIYFATLFFGGAVLKKQPEQRTVGVCHWPLFAIDRKWGGVTISMDNNWIYCIGFAFAWKAVYFFCIVCVCVFLHSEVVQMCEHHHTGTVTHWPTSTKENFVCFDKHTRTERVSDRYTERERE